MTFQDKRGEDRLFLVDASASMNRRLDANKIRKIDIVKYGLKRFCLERWPLTYYEWPLRIGIVAFHLLGTPGRAVFDVIVPLQPTPAYLELYRIDELNGRGGSPVFEALRYGSTLIKESTRRVKRIKFIGDGDIEGPDPLPLLEEVAMAGIIVDSIELSERPSELMRQLATRGGGKYYHVQNIDQFIEAIKEPNMT